MDDAEEPRADRAPMAPADPAARRVRRPGFVIGQIALGALAMLVLRALVEWDAPAEWMQALPAVALVVGTIGALGCWGRLRAAVAFGYAAGFALFITGLTALAWWAEAAMDQAWRPGPQVWLFVGAWGLIPWAFLVAHERAPNGFRDYEALTRESWSLVLRVFLAAGAMIAALIVGWMFAALLSTLGLDWLERALESGWLRDPALGAVAGAANAALLRAERQVVRPLVVAVHWLLRALLPVAVPLGILYLASLLAGGPLWFVPDESWPLNLALGMLGVILVTAAIDPVAPLPRWLSALARLAAPLTAVLAALALADLWTALQRRPPTAGDLVALGAAAAVLLYGLGYSLGALWPGRWPALAQAVNIALALVVAAALALAMLPPFDPVLRAADLALRGVEEGRWPASAVRLPPASGGALAERAARLEALRAAPPAPVQE